MSNDVSRCVAGNVDDVGAAGYVQDVTVEHRLGRPYSWESEEAMTNRVNQQRGGVGAPGSAQQPAPWKVQGSTSQGGICFMEEYRSTRFSRKARSKTGVVGVGMGDEDRLNVFDAVTHRRQALLEQSVVTGEAAVDNGQTPSVLDDVPVELVVGEVVYSGCDFHIGNIGPMAQPVNSPTNCILC